MGNGIWLRGVGVGHGGETRSPEIFLDNLQSKMAFRWADAF